MSALSLIVMAAGVAFPAKPVPPADLQRLKTLLRVIEQPCWSTRTGPKGPCSEAPPTVDFVLQQKECWDVSQFGPEAIAPLVRLFNDRTKHVQARANAAYALADFCRGYRAGPEPRALAVLKAALQDESPGVRGAACCAVFHLGRHTYRYGLRDGSPNTPRPEDSALRPNEVPAVARLVAASVGDPNPRTACHALEALFNLGEPGIGTKEVFAALARNEANVRAEAVMALAQVAPKDPRSLPAVLACLRDDDDVQRSAVVSLSEGWSDNDQAAAVVLKLLDGPLDNPSCSSAIRVLERFGKLKRPALPKLINILKQTCNSREDKVFHVRDDAIKALAKMGSSAQPAVPAILKCLPAHYEERVIGYLKQIDPQEARRLQANMDKRVAEEEAANERRFPKAYGPRRPEFDPFDQPKLPPVIQLPGKPNDL